MARSWLIATFILLVFNTSISQTLNYNVSDTCVLMKRFKTKLFLIKQKLVADSLFRIYGDDSLMIEKKLSKDTALVYSLIDPKSSAHDSLILSAYKIPFIVKPVGWVSDYAHLFTNDQIEKLDSTLNKFEKETTNEIAVLTLDSSFNQRENFDSLILSIHNFWGVGKEVKNNGILIGISVNQRKIRINNGYGIESKLSNEETKKIIDDIVSPEFKRGNYFIGLNDAIIILMQKTR